MLKTEKIVKSFWLTESEWFQWPLVTAADFRAKDSGR